MNPRVFISSTFYDLKYARESLGQFVESYGFTPIRSEAGDIGYTPGQELDESCYNAMNLSDMAILVVGGRYGSPASGEEKKDAFSHYLSVTRKEFNTAVESAIPIYVFIEDGVHGEYRTYLANKTRIEGDPLHSFQPAHADSVNVYRFIESIYSVSKLAITSFRDMEDIKSYLRKQWADMFQKYLISLKRQENLVALQSPINQIFSKIEQMDVMLSHIGKQIISTPEELQSIQKTQSAEAAAATIARSFDFLSSLSEPQAIRQFILFFLDRLVEARDEDLLECGFSDDPSDRMAFFEKFTYEGVTLISIKEHLKYESFMESLELCKEEVAENLMKDPYLRQMGLIINN